MTKSSLRKDHKYWLKFIDKKNFDYTTALTSVAKNMARIDHPMKSFYDLGKILRSRYKRQAHTVLVDNDLVK